MYLGSQLSWLYFGAFLRQRLKGLLEGKGLVCQTEQSPLLLTYMYLFWSYHKTYLMPFLTIDWLPIDWLLLSFHRMFFIGCLYQETKWDHFSKILNQFWICKTPQPYGTLAHTSIKIKINRKFWQLNPDHLWSQQKLWQEMFYAQSYLAFHHNKIPRNFFNAKFLWLMPIDSVKILIFQS